MALASSNSNKKYKYGFITIFAFIVAAVIGIGIDLKATTVMDLTNSAYLTMFGFVLLAFVSLCLALAFVEISSSTIISKKSESGTLSNWGTKFYNKKTGSFIGLFTVFIYIPLTVIALGILSSRILINIFIDQIDALQVQVALNPKLYGLVIFGFTIVFVMFFVFINMVSIKFTNVFQIIGVILKIIPLTLISLIIIAFLIAKEPGTPGGYNGNWNQFGAVGESGDILKPSIGGFFLALPAIMFTFDGFVFAGSFQDDTKSKKTFQNALVSGVVIVIFIYLLLIATSVSIGTPGKYAVPDIILILFGTGPLGISFKITFLIFIVISGASGLNSFLMFGTRNLSELSEHGELYNPTKNLSKRTEKGTFKNALTLICFVFIGYLLFFLILDFSLTPWSEVGYLTADGIWYSKDYPTGILSSDVVDSSMISISSYFGNVYLSVTDIGVMLSFFVYAFILIGGIRNRRTNKVKVNKEKGFLFFAWSAAILIFLIVFLYFISMILGYFHIGSDVNSNDATYGSFYAPIIILCLFIGLIIFWNINNKLISKNNINSSSNSQDDKNQYLDSILELDDLSVSLDNEQEIDIKIEKGLDP